jgi:hypothetical protein
MALTDNRTQLQDCEAVGDVSTDSTADPQSNTSEAGVVIQGTNALQFQVTNAQEYLAYDQDAAGATFNLDLSDSTVYIMIKDNLHDDFASLGGQIVLDDTADGTSTTTIGYAVAGYDVIGLPYEKKYSAMKLDVSVVVASPGTSGVDFFQHNGTEANLDQTIIKQVGYGSIHLIKGQGTIPNTFFDGIYYIANDSYAATISGGTSGTPETMADLVGDDITVGAGLFSNPIGAAYYIFAPTEWGDAGTATTAFAGTDEQWYYLGDNGGGHAVGATHFPMRLVGNATGTNIFRQTRVTNINVGTRSEFDWSDANFDEITLDNVTWVDFGVITAPGTDVDKNFTVGTFNNCDQFIMNAMNMTDITFNGAFDANGAVLLDTSGDSNNAVNLIFNSDGTGHAVEITVAGTYDLDNWVYNDFGADGTTDAAVYISANVAVTLNIQNGGDTPTVRNSGTAPTINNAVTVAVDGVAEGTSCKVIANETLGTITTGDVIFELLADSTGTAQITDFNYEGAFGAGLDVLVRARNQGLPNAAIADDNDVYTDETTEANSGTSGDMNLLPATPVVNQDRYLFGHSEQFDRLKVNVSTAGTGGFTITWQYWNGAWVNLSGVTDGTSSFSTLGTNIVSFTLPGDWATTTVNSQGPYYYVRAAFTAGSVTVTPLGRSGTLDVTRYLPIPPSGDLVRTITSAGLTATLSQAVDSIAKFDPLND